MGHNVSARATAVSILGALFAVTVVLDLHLTPLAGRVTVNPLYPPILLSYIDFRFTYNQTNPFLPCPIRQ